MRNASVIAKFSSRSGYVQTRPVHKGICGIQLVVQGIEWPAPYICDICNHGDKGTETITGEQTIMIPDKYLQSGRDIIVYLVNRGERTRRTVGKIRIPVIG